MEPSPEIRKLIDEGRDLVNNGQADKAVEHYRKSIARTLKLGEEKWAGWFWEQMGVAEKIRGRCDEALIDIKTAIEIFKKINEEFDLGCAYRDAGLVELHRGKFRNAAIWLQLSVETLRKTRDANSLGISLAKRGIAETGMKHYPKARKTFEEALRVMRTQGDWFMEMSALMGYANLDFVEERYQEMINKLWAGLGMIYDYGHQEKQKRRLAEIYGFLAQGYFHTGARELSKKLLLKSEELLKEMPEDVAKIVREGTKLEELRF